MLVLYNLMLRCVRMDYILASIFCILVVNFYASFLSNSVSLVGSLKKCQAMCMHKFLYKW